MSSSDPLFQFEIQGKLRMTPINGIIANVPVTLSYSVNGSYWQDIVEVVVDENGLFLVEWQIGNTGKYLIRAIYGGNESFVQSDALFNLATLSYVKPNDFSFFSNSSVSKLFFNSERKELSFWVAGESGTNGYIDVYIEKNLVKNISLLRVYLDENEIQYSYDLIDNSWKIQFSYTHSDHSVVMLLDSTVSLERPTPTSTPTPNPEQFATTLTVTSIAIAVVGLGILAYFKNKRKK